MYRVNWTEFPRVLGRSAIYGDKLAQYLKFWKLPLRLSQEIKSRIHDAIRGSWFGNELHN